MIVYFVEPNWYRQINSRRNNLPNHKRRKLSGLQAGSAEYVIAHAKWSALRGRKPSATYKGISNPRRALATAEADLLAGTKKRKPRARKTAQPESVKQKPIEVECYGMNLIATYCPEMSARPEYYSGYGVRRDCLDSKQLVQIFNGLRRDYGEEASQRFCAMVESLTDLSPTNFLNQFYMFIGRRMVWQKTLEESNLDVGPDTGDGKREAIAFATVAVSCFGFGSKRSPEEERGMSEDIKEAFFRAVGYEQKQKYERKCYMDFNDAFPCMR